ncbi:MULTISPECIES: hypothetical protein [Halolamina]|uniref:Uncharacterized protein n=1 Tax=Halolamina pelagica TaxID=699431 RepID=A0A1I5U8E4_9EURY|nr:MULTISPECIES: hypothetical protein [Halolamina]NHX37180.1 hypothetical protein [Halolamina sp. R1-12]SFP91534.1 hypothetical protein SAMN05216277_1126 [Halolamina pelagica]
MPITDEYGDGLARVDADVVADPSDYDTFVAVFARTYSHSENPAALVDLYNDFQKARAKRPNAGSSSLANKLGVPRSNIRRWTDDGAVPYVVQGLQTAETRGWIPMSFDSVEFRAMNRLIAWVLSSGSIHGERWGVQFVVDDDRARDRVEAALTMLDLEAREYDEAGTNINGTLLGVSADGSVLGRVLYSLGAPKGDDKQRPDVQLPPYLDRAPEGIKRAWLTEYLQNRRREQDGDPWISFGEDRPAVYQRQFVELVEDVTAASASASETDIYVSAAAVRELGLA